jgi:hypothetical protein
MRLFRWLRALWWARLRAYDMAVLWPQCKRLARDIDHAKAAFAVHASTDRAWREGLGDKALIAFIEALD